MDLQTPFPISRQTLERQRTEVRVTSYTREVVTELANAWALGLMTENPWPGDRCATIRKTNQTSVAHTRFYTQDAPPTATTAKRSAPAATWELRLSTSRFSGLCLKDVEVKAYPTQGQSWAHWTGLHNDKCLRTLEVTPSIRSEISDFIRSQMLSFRLQRKQVPLRSVRFYWEVSNVFPVARINKSFFTGVRMWPILQPSVNTKGCQDNTPSPHAAGQQPAPMTPLTTASFVGVKPLILTTTPPCELFTWSSIYAQRPSRS